MTMTGCPDLDESIRTMRDDARYLGQLSRQIVEADPVTGYSVLAARRFQRADLTANFRSRGERLALHADAPTAGRALLFATRVVNDLFRALRREPRTGEVARQVLMARRAAEQDLEMHEADLVELRGMIAADRQRIAAAAALEDYMEKSR